MPDITMCQGKNCPKKNLCYRHLAKPDRYWQSWFAETPSKADGECEHFWPVSENKTSENG